jgi:hypothetical protein
MEAIKLRAKHLEEEAKVLKLLLDEEEAKSSESSNPKKRLRSDTERQNLKDYVERYKEQRDRYERLYSDILKEKSASWNCLRDEFKESLDRLKRQRDDAISHAADAIREKDDVICRLDNALGTKCEICDEQRCFLGKICANDCNHRCCNMCMIDMGFNRHHRCPWCRGELSPEALQDLRNLDRKLATPVYLSRPTTPRNRVQDSLHFIMQGQLPDLTPQQISRRLDDLFAQAPTTVTEMFEAALPPAPATPAANVSGSNATVVNGTTYYFDD